MSSSNKPAPSTSETASQAYARRAAEIDRLIDVLQEELAHHHAGNADSTNWGFVGNLAKVKDDLVKTISFISGMTEQEINAFLAE